MRNENVKCILVLCIFVIHSAVTNPNLCQNTKSNGSCVCYRRHIRDNEKMSVFTVADCSNIELDSFPSPRVLESSLNELDLSYNAIERLEQNNDVIPYQSLLNLDLSHNNLNHIKGDFFEDKQNLLKLNLSYNNLSSFDNADIFSNLKNLHVIDISFNKIQVVEDIFKPLNNLRHLDLSYNNLHHIFINVTRPLRDILSLTTNIRYLALNALGIRQIQKDFFDGLVNITQLFLADNGFDEIPNLPKDIRYLDLSGNKIFNIATNNLHYLSLKVLQLNRLTNLESIERYAFYHLSSLEELSIMNCRRLKILRPDVFGVMVPQFETSLKKLSLRGSGLQTLEENYTHLATSLNYMDLNNNPWNCNCSLLWMTGIKHLLFKSDQIRCAYPKQLVNKKFFQLEDNDLPDCYPEKYGSGVNRLLVPLLIALVILLCILIIYLLYYAPNTLGKSRIISPNSPYSQVVVADDDL